MKHLVRVQLSFPLNSATQEHVARIQIRDDKSGVMLACFELTPDQWINLSACSGTDVESISGELSRVGKNLITESEQYPRGTTEEEAHRLAGNRYYAECWQEYDVRKSNQGWYTIFKKWVEDGSCAA